MTEQKTFPFGILKCHKGMLDCFLKCCATFRRLGTYIFLSVDCAKNVLLALDLFESGFIGIINFNEIKF